MDALATAPAVPALDCMQQCMGQYPEWLLITGTACSGVDWSSCCSISQWCSAAMRWHIGVTFMASHALAHNGKAVEHIRAPIIAMAKIRRMQAVYLTLMT